MAPRQSQRQPRPHGGVSTWRRYVRPYPAWGGDSVRYALRLPRETCTDEGGDTWPCVSAWWNPAAQPRERPAFAIAADGAVRRVPDRPELVLAHKVAPPVLSLSSSSCAITTARDHNNNSRHHRRSSSPVASPTTRPSRPTDGASPSSTTNGRRDLGAISARSRRDPGLTCGIVQGRSRRRRRRDISTTRAGRSDISTARNGGALRRPARTPKRTLNHRTQSHTMPSFAAGRTTGLPGPTSGHAAPGCRS